MNAKEAYAIAASKNNIQDILGLILAAATSGKTHIHVDLLNDFQVTELTKLGYWTLPDHAPETWAIAGSSRPTKHKISWVNGGMDDETKTKLNNPVGILGRL